MNDRLTGSIETLTETNARLAANNETLTDSVAQLKESLAKVISDKEAAEMRMGKQIARLRSSKGNLLRKSTEMDDVDSPPDEELRQMRQELSDERSNAVNREKDLAELREELKKKDAELNGALEVLELKVKELKVKVDEANETWKGKFECLRIENYNLTEKYETLKTQYEKEHEELMAIKLQIY